LDPPIGVGGGPGAHSRQGFAEILTVAQIRVGGQLAEALHVTMALDEAGQEGAAFEGDHLS